MSRTAAALAVVMAACASSSPHAASYLREMRSAPTTFTVAPALDKVAWERAHSFVKRFSSMKIRRETDSVLATHRPPSDETSFGYSVTRTPGRSGVVFKVECYPRDRWERTHCEQNAGIAATFVRTGDLPYPDLIHK